VTFATREVITDSAGRAVLVEAVPKGGLKGQTPTSGPITWRSTVPGELGILGYLTNKLVHRGRWLVLVRPIVAGHPTRPTWTGGATDMEAANALASETIAMLREGRPLPTEAPHTGTA
jgi:hypothetical protein